MPGSFIKKSGAMKLAFVIHNEFFTPQVMQLLDTAGIDYYTRWDRTVGKGAGTDAHLGEGRFPATNSVLMIAFQDEAPLEALIAAIQAANKDIQRADDRIRLFQLPLDRIV